MSLPQWSNSCDGSRNAMIEAAVRIDNRLFERKMERNGGANHIFEHEECVVLDITQLGEGYDVVLGYPWLKQHNPSIDWRKGFVRFMCGCLPYQQDHALVATALRVRESEDLSLQLNSAMDALQDANQGTKKESLASKDDGNPIHAKEESVRPDDYETDDENMEASNKSEEEIIRDKLPKEYWDYIASFKDYQGNEVLPEHQPWDHEINLEEGMKPVKKPIYRYFMTTKELTRRQARWYADVLVHFDFTIRHCKGKENYWSDALSRRPDLMTKKKENRALFKLNESNELTLESQHLLATRMIIEESDLYDQIRKELKKDDWVKAIDPKTERFIWQDGLLLYKGLIYVPPSVRKRIMSENHDEPTAGHFGVDKTMEKITRTYYWPAMWRMIRKYVSDCDICRRSKTERHQPYGELQPLKPAEHPWSSIALDFIVKLPKSKAPTGEEYDSILTITERLTKFAYFIPVREAISAPEVAYILFRYIVANHGLPKEIISDRDARFLSNFWQTLLSLVGIQHKPSTAYHPQTDGQTERLNQTVEQYLRCYVNYEQTNWALHHITPITEENLR
ncbi:Ribonuclease H-like protein [Ascosphaera apis ARSEF 7405]|uniref:Ribonuclease H-like protein n=1 Tax=Ascosphaera apis ARSEF 7405 TaxID=392613 RepID=A0A162IK99_9EURO|nr:Ribonuclease H-like protein [Ascosphaera apis ARSEF 7405]